MEQSGVKISFTDDERTLTGLPESIQVDQALEVLACLSNQAKRRRQQLVYIRERPEGCFRGMIPAAENNLLLLGRMINKLSDIAAPQIIEHEINKLRAE